MVLDACQLGLKLFSCYIYIYIYSLLSYVTAHYKQKDYKYFLLECIILILHIIDL